MKFSNKKTNCFNAVYTLFPDISVILCSFTVQSFLCLLHRTPLENDFVFFSTTQTLQSFICFYINVAERKVKNIAKVKLEQKIRIQRQMFCSRSDAHCMQFVDLYFSLLVYLLLLKNNALHYTIFMQTNAKIVTTKINTILLHKHKMYIKKKHMISGMNLK